jgi:hypothetical protein
VHNCPECGCACYCNGDIDDCDVGDEEAELACTHYLKSECQQGDDNATSDIVEKSR